MASTARRPSRPSPPLASLIVEEVLGTVLAPDRLDELISESLGMAALPGLPEEGTALRAYVEGPLFATLSRHLDVSDALELVGQIRAALELALREPAPERPASHVRSNPTLPAAPQRVLVLTRASLVVFLLQDVLGDAVEVMPLSTLAALKDRLRRLGPQPVLLVVDRKHPSVGPDACAELRGELSGESTVVWWGAPSAEAEQVTHRMRGGPRLVACDFDLQLADLGALCKNLLNQG
jgi:hypothetical protein